MPPKISKVKTGYSHTVSTFQFVSKYIVYSISKSNMPDRVTPLNYIDLSSKQEVMDRVMSDHENEWFF
jgi:hypothetical protein